MSRLRCTDRSCARQRLLAAARVDYRFFVRARVLDASQRTWQAFLAGYLWMEECRDEKNRQGMSV